jgi:hypothetical protein
VDFVTDEFILARTGEVLEARLRGSEKFQQQVKALHEASKAFLKGSGTSKRCWKLYDILEDEWTKYNILYGEEAYRLGFEDGVQVASERQIRVEGSVLSVKDMTHLIYLYDAIRELNKLLFGEWEIHGRDGGIIGVLDRVCDVIEDGAYAEVRMCGEDEMYECLTDILDNPRMTPEERAEKLAGGVRV